MGGKDKHTLSRVLTCVIALLVITIPAAQARTLSESANLNYDDNGNLIDNEQYEFVYDSLNQLIEVYNQNNLIESYGYDDAGNRIWKEDAEGKITYYTDYLVREELEGEVTDTAYYYHDGVLIAENTKGEWKYYHPNHLGSTDVITDSAGNIIEDIDYLPFGLTVDEESSRYDFTGKETDNTGLTYFESRYYSPEYRRFIQPDSLLPDIYDPQQLNRYSYVRNNPVKNIDPDGHFIFTLTALVVIGIVGGGAIGGGANLISQINNGANLGTANYGEAGKWAAVGAAAGGVGGATFGLGTAAFGTGIAGYTAAGAISGVAAGRTNHAGGNVIQGNAITNNLWNPGAMAMEAGIGALTAGAGRYLGGATSNTPKVSASSINSKLYKYSLNPTHQGGGSDKARVFKSALGFDRSNMNKLSSQIQKQFSFNKATYSGNKGYGPQFRQTMSVKGINGRTADVDTGWIVIDNEVKLTNAYVK